MVVEVRTRNAAVTRMDAGKALSFMNNLHWSSLRGWGARELRMNWGKDCL
jgi:hypothetical protein